MEFFSKQKKTWVKGFVYENNIKILDSNKIILTDLQSNFIEINLLTDLVRHRHLLYKGKTKYFFVIVYSSTKSTKHGLLLKSVDGEKILKVNASYEKLHECGPPWSACHLAGKYKVSIPSLNNYSNEYLIRPDGYCTVKLKDIDGGLGHCVLMRFPDGEATNLTNFHDLIDENHQNLQFSTNLSSSGSWRYLLKGHHALWKCEKWRWVCCDNNEHDDGVGNGSSSLPGSKVLDRHTNFTPFGKLFGKEENEKFFEGKKIHSTTKESLLVGNHCDNDDDNIKKSDNDGVRLFGVDDHVFVEKEEKEKDKEMGYFFLII